MNANYGVENFKEINIRHSKFAANRSANEAAPALSHFADSSPAHFLNGIEAARERIVARTDEGRASFLRTRGFSEAGTNNVIATVFMRVGRYLVLYSLGLRWPEEAALPRFR